MPGVAGAVLCFAALAFSALGNSALFPGAFFTGMGLYTGLVLGSGEAFVYYDDEEEHMVMSLARLLSYVAPRDPLGQPRFLYRPPSPGERLETAPRHKQL